MEYHDMLINIANKKKDWVVDIGYYLTAHPDLHEIVDAFAAVGEYLPAHDTLLATLAWTMEALHAYGPPIDLHEFPIIKVVSEEHA